MPINAVEFAKIICSTDINVFTIREIDKSISSFQLFIDNYQSYT